MMGPSEWASVPRRFSYSSLTALARCPLQWQLLYSRYGQLGRFPQRPNLAALEGDVIHEVLDALYRELTVAGLPELGSDEFRACVARFDVRRQVAQRLELYGARLDDHARAAGLRLEASPQQVTNKVIRLLRAEYRRAQTNSTAPPQAAPPPTRPSSSIPMSSLARLAQRGVLTEFRVHHPELPLMGVIDLAWMSSSGVVIVDFKTGATRDEHREQLDFYALLWWRQTGELPVAVEVRYLAACVTWQVSESTLLALEEQLAERVESTMRQLASPPPVPREGDHCARCQVRVFCTLPWPRAEGDLEIAVIGGPGQHDLRGRATDGTVWTVVFERAVREVFGPFVQGETLRIIAAALDEESRIAELRPWSEVYHRPTSDVPSVAGNA